MIDDIRFYGTALNETQVAIIAGDDLTGALQAGYKNQTIYDEGSNLSGFTVALENGVVKAKVTEAGAFAQVLSNVTILDDSLASFSGELWGITQILESLLGRHSCRRSASSKW